MADLMRQALVLLVGLGLLCGLGALLPRPRLGPVLLLPVCVAHTLAAVTFVAIAADALGWGLSVVRAALVVLAVIAASWRARRVLPWSLRHGAFASWVRARQSKAGTGGPVVALLRPALAGLGWPVAPDERAAARVEPRACHAASRREISGGDLACFAVALLAAALALWSGTWFSHGADTFYHLAAARTQALDGAALVRRVFVPETVGPDPTSGTWHVVLALVATTTRQDVATVWAVLAPVWAGLLVLGIAALGRVASGCGWTGALGALAYIALERRLDLRTAPFPNEVAWLPLAVALAFAVHRLAELRTHRIQSPQGQGWRPPRWGAACAALAVGTWTAAASGVHLAHFGAALLLLGLLALAALLLPTARGAGLAVPAWLLLLGAAVGGGLPAGYRLLTLLDTPTGKGALGLGEPLAQAYLAPWMPLGWSLPLVVADPGAWFRSPAIGAASVATLALARRAWRGDAGAGLLIVGTWLVPLVALQPVVAPLALERFSYAIAKLATLLRPLPYLGMAWVLTALSARRRAAWRWRAAWAVSAIGLGCVVALEAPRVAATTFGPADPQGHSVAASRAADVRVQWADLLAALDALPGRAVLLADPETSYALAGLTRHWVVGVPLSHTPAQIAARDGVLRRGDTLDFFYHGPERAVEVLERYGATHVVALRQLGDGIAGYPFLARAAAGSTWQLYAYDRRRLGEALDVPVEARGGGVSAGMLTNDVPAGGVALVRIRGYGWPARLELLQDGNVLAQRELPQADECIVALPIPANAPPGRATVRLVGPQDTREIAALTIGWLLEAELLRGLSPDRDYDYAQVHGWASYSMSFFSRQRAATTARPGVVLRGTLPGRLPAGDYTLRARVYDYGNGRTNSLRVRIAHTSTFVIWRGATAEMRWVEAHTRGVDGNDLEIEALEVGQGRIVLDALAIFPR